MNFRQLVVWQRQGTLRSSASSGSNRQSYLQITWLVRIMIFKRCSTTRKRIMSPNIRQLITGTNISLGYQNNTTFIMPNTHNPCIAVWCALHRKVETSNGHLFQSCTFLLETRARDPYRMIDQACHVSLVCGINNNFLTDFEKLCTHKKDSQQNVIIILLDKLSKDMVNNDITKYQIQIHPHMIKNATCLL